MKGYSNLLEWLGDRGNPKHFIAEGVNGHKIIALDRNEGDGLSVFTFTEGNGGFWIGSEQVILKTELNAIKGYLSIED